MRRYARYAKKYWYSFLFGPVFMVLEACGEFVLPYINANIINIGAAGGDIPYIIRNGIYMLLIAVGMLIAGVLGANFAVRGSARLAAGVRQEAFDRIQKFSFANIDDFSTGSLITRITNDITQIQNFVQTLLRGMFRSPIMIIGALIMSFVLNPQLAGIILIVVPLLGLAIAAIIKTASPRYSVMQEKIDSLNSNIGETVTNERVIKSFVREEYEKKKFSAVNDELVEKSTAALKMMLLMQPVSSLAINGTTLAVVWFAGRQIMVGGMELGTLTAFITYLSQVLTALNFLANIVLQGTRAAASHRRITQIMEAEIDINDDAARRKQHIISSGKIELSHVSFRYFKSSRERVLDDVSLTIDSGETVGIIGATGSGKTTLVSLIPRLYDPDEGSVFVDGVDVRELSIELLRESVSVVLQNNTLFSGTIAQNLRWGDENASDEELRAAARIAQADDFVCSFPEGYNTYLGQGGVNLSGGQKQRLCIARALLKKPKILILDDSTSAVDTSTDAAIRRGFAKALPGVTKIIIAQRINSVKDADKIIVLEKGRVVGCGNHGSLMASCPAYSDIYWSQNDSQEAVAYE